MAETPNKHQQYKDPAGGTESSIGPQALTQYYYKQALIEAAKERFFGQLADVRTMPKNMGKKIVQMVYIPLLDDKNVNDQGIDATGATIANGNLYGSSKDVGTIKSKMPTLTENGGRVNRVGFKRKLIEGSFEKYGFFQEYTQESLDFDSDAELMQHISREMINGANEMTEDLLQIDLLSSAGTIRYTGAATSKVTMDKDSVVTYMDLMRLNIDLNNNRTPTGFKMITGSRNIDTRTVAGARVLYIGSELIPILRAMKDLHGAPAFIELHKYAAAGADTVIGEIGTIDAFKIVVVPEMMKWAGAGSDSTPGDGLYHETGGKFDVFPMLCVGEGSFTTIGFQTDGKTVKFTIYNKKPGEGVADRFDPYGEKGFTSIKWYYGFMALRPERIGLILTLATL